MSGGIFCRDLELVRRGSSGQERTIFTDVNADFPAGNITLITGPAGSGKSSLLYILAGLIRPTRGEVLDGEEAVSRWLTPHRDLWRKGVGIVFQHFQLFAELTAEKNVMIPLLPKKWPYRRIRNRANEALERLSAGHLSQMPVHFLSGGERQRVAVARALAADPAILLADEPTAHQDPEGMKIVMDVFAEARDRARVVVIAAHDPRIAGIADRYYRFIDGRLLHDRGPESQG